MLVDRGDPATRLESLRGKEYRKAFVHIKSFSMFRELITASRSSQRLVIETCEIYLFIPAKLRKRRWFICQTVVLITVNRVISWDIQTLHCKRIWVVHEGNRPRRKWWVGKLVNRT